jgi:2-polyprenyl-3-methyl-5-hydroxy-6-metoxy-1,4-benzoquinol methylase
MTQEIFKKHFQMNAKEWLEKNYNTSDAGHYQVGSHRLRLVKKIISNMFSQKVTITDMGCGGGNVSVELARMGHYIYGYDQSNSMLDQARELASSESLNDLLSFRHFEIGEESVTQKTNVFLALGLIGYLDNPLDLLKIADQALDPGGIAIISSRNKMFNFFSPSFRTIKSMKSEQETNEILSEIDSLVKSSKLKGKKIKIPEGEIYFGDLLNPFSPPESNSIEPAQFLPSQLDFMSKSFGFERLNLYGIHPHLISTQISRICENSSYYDNQLNLLEEDSMSLLWSSVFIAVYAKK